MLLDPDLDVFASIAETQPLFKAWREQLLKDEIDAPDGETSYV